MTLSGATARRKKTSAVDNNQGALGRPALLGIGPYTAAAIAAIAFGRRTMPVDGNIERVVSRLYAVEEPLPQAKPLIQQLAATLLADTGAGDEKSRAGDEESRAGDSAQA